MNTELVKQALEKVGNPNTLVGIISRRVRQLSQGGGGLGRPLVENAAQLGAADVALREIIEEKIGWDVPPDQPPSDTTITRRKRRGGK